MPYYNEIFEARLPRIPFSEFSDLLVLPEDVSDGRCARPR